MKSHRPSLLPLLPLLLLAACAGSPPGEMLCPGNKFIYLSTYVLGLQTDLKLTFAEITRSIKVDEVFYQEEIYRSYRIYNISQNIIYNEDKQTAKLAQENVLRVTGAPVRIEFNFSWVKTQLGQPLNGTGSGSVTSEPITYEKTLQTNVSHELQWQLTYSEPLAITNGFALNSIDPYRAADYEIISNMLNMLKNNQTTVRENFLKAINARLQAILAVKVLEDKTLEFEKTIRYTYSDYRSGVSEITYAQILMNSTLADDGLYLLFSQVIEGDENFECGDPVPFKPNDPKTFGGMQQFYSNSLIKSTLRNAVNEGALDVVLNEEWWQSRAFQFYMGDLQEVMPTATRHMNTMINITGRCKALNDPVFSFAMKNTKAYEAKVNFACNLDFNNTHLITIDLVVSYEITPKLTSKTLDIQITNIAGTPAFIENPPFKIQYQELADFMVSETLALTKNGFVYGTGYKMKYPRKYPSLWVRQNYLFLYDASATPRKIDTV